MPMNGGNNHPGLTAKVCLLKPLGGAAPNGVISRIATSTTPYRVGAPREYVQPDID